MRYRTRVPNYCMDLLRKRGYVMISRTNIKYLLTFLIVIVIAFTVWGVTGANASKPVGQKYYVSITIEPGDTLWSIAEENISDEYKNIKEYIKEVRSINSLTTTDITAGRHLVIPRYTKE